MIDIRFLGDEDLGAMHATFTAAFADYAVTMRPDPPQLERMMRQRSVDLGLSIGAFADGEMIGVSATGRRGDRAYVIFTGVVPARRGQGVARRMFERLLPTLAENGVERVGLEVLRQNERAVAAYGRAGFEVVRDLECFTLEAADVASAQPPAGVEIERRNAPDWPTWAAFRDWEPTWQHDAATIERTEGDVVLLEAARDGRPVGCAVVQLEGGVLAWLAVARDARRTGVGSALLAAASEPAGTLRILNVDAGAAGDLAFYAARGARPTVGQHEMVRAL